MRCSQIDHVKVVRFHTRVPVAEPERVTRELVRALKARAKATYVAVHANHPRELTEAARAACARIADAGIPLVARRCCWPASMTCPDVWRADARLRRMPDQAILSASRRPGARHRPFPHDHREGQELMRALARPIVRTVPADLRPRHSRRPRQIADRPELHRASWLRRPCSYCHRRLQRAAPPLSRASVGWPSRPEKRPQRQGWQSQ